jgi:hypothetical protein
MYGRDNLFFSIPYCYFFIIDFSYPTRKPKLIDGDDYSNENGNSDNFIDEYQE